MAAGRLSFSLHNPLPAARPRRTVSAAEKKSLPVRKVPGDYGLPLIGPVNDRLDFFYRQGREDFFRSRIRQHGSTVVRLNMPPGPPIAANPAVVAILDGAAFPVLFDSSKVEKRDLFTGTFMPSLELTGGYRILSYLDSTEPTHAIIKNFLFYLQKSTRSSFIPEFSTSFGAAFDQLEGEIAEKGKAEFNEVNDQAAFRFLCRAFFDRDPTEARLGSDGPGLVGKWVLFQLAPIVTLGLPSLIEDVLLHSLRLPPTLVRSDYRRLYEFFFSAAAPALAEAERMGISKEEACHNIVFAVCFNAFGGFKILFPSMMRLVARAGIGVHTRMAEEVRTTVRAHGGQVTMKAIEEMALVKSAVYETLRIEPPVPFQYGKARRDLVIESHDVAYEVKAGEILFGYQPFATRDKRIFDRAEEFIVDRFVGDGEKLLRHVIWSNGPETESTAADNKQCAGKNFVVLAARLLLVELFLRYDSFDVVTKSSPLGYAISLTSLKRATF